MKRVVINKEKKKELEKYGFYMEDGIYQYKRVVDNQLAYKLYVTKDSNYLQLNTYGPVEMTGNIFALVHELIEKGIATVYDR